MKCEKHGFDKLYFCLADDCQEPTCPDCYFEEHVGHPKKSLQAVYDERKREVDGVIDTLDEQVSELVVKEKEMEAKVTEVKD